MTSGGKNTKSRRYWLNKHFRIVFRVVRDQYETIIPFNLESKKLRNILKVKSFEHWHTKIQGMLFSIPVCICIYTMQTPVYDGIIMLMDYLPSTKSNIALHSIAFLLKLIIDKQETNIEGHLSMLYLWSL